MTILYIPKPDIPKAYTHDSTDWQVATSPLFEDDSIVAESRDDEDHLTSIVFDVDLDKGKKYYSRARIVCDKAVFEWSKTDIIQVTDFIKVAFNYAIPSAVMKPEIKLDFDPANFPSTLFNIGTTPISTTSNADHDSSFYIIEDISGIPEYTKFDDFEDRENKLLSGIKLEEGRPYVIKVAHKSTSNDMSEFASEVIYVKDIKEIILKSKTENPDISDGYNVSIAPVDSFSKMYVKLYGIGEGDSKELFSGESDETNLIIPEDKFVLDVTNLYILGIEVEKENGDLTGWKYFSIKFI